jgi:hypothetical protein
LIQSLYSSGLDRSFSSDSSCKDIRKILYSLFICKIFVKYSIIEPNLYVILIGGKKKKEEREKGKLSKTQNSQQSATQFQTLSSASSLSLSLSLTLSLSHSLSLTLTP